MIRKIFILLFISVLLAGCISGEPAEKGTLQLTSSPAGAEIYLDNQYRGTTPGTIAGVEPGSHSLEVRSKGYKSWKSAVTVSSGTSNYFASLTAQPGSEPEPEIIPAATAEPVAVTLQISRDQIIVGDSVTFSGIATGTNSVSLTITGPGKYANGVALEDVKPGASDEWTSTWNPGTKIQSGTYTIIATDAAKTVSRRATFTVTGDGVVSVSPNSYAVVTGETVVLSGRCSTGAPTVRVVLSGPGRFGGGVEIGNVAVTADQTWSMRYTTDLSMPAGVYSVYVSDVPQSTTGSTQFTIGFAS
jgi:uncharacterized protein YceK